MPSVYALKPQFQRILRPIVRWLVSLGITANSVTLFTCVLSIGTGLFLAYFAPSQRWFLLLAPFLFLRMALNAIDGQMAREFNQKSDLGAYLNELTDVLSDAFLLLPFAYIPGFDPLWVGIAIVLSVLSEMAGTVAVITGASRRYDGPMGKSDRAAVFGAMSLWLGSGRSLTPWAAYIFLLIVCALTAITILNRVRNGLAETHSQRLKTAAHC